MIFLIFFSFKTIFGKKIKTWICQIIFFFIVVWVVFLMSIFFEFPQTYFLSYMQQYNLKNVLFWHQNFNTIFKINFFFFWLSTLPGLFFLILCITCIGFCFTNTNLRTFLYKYFWLIFFLIWLSFFFFFWHFYLTETVSLNFRNPAIDKPKLLKLWYGLTKYRASLQFDFIFCYIELFILFTLLMLGLFYLFGRIYFSILKDEIKK